MEWSTAGQAAAALGAAAAAAQRWLRVAASAESRRRTVLRYLDLYDRLPEMSNARTWLGQLIDQQVGLLLAESQVHKRVDPVGIGLGLVFLAAGGAVSYRILAVDWSGWWWFVVGLLILVGLVGLSQDAVPRERDERGRPTRRPTPATTAPASGSGPTEQGDAVPEGPGSRRLGLETEDRRLTGGALDPREADSAVKPSTMSDGPTRTD